LRPIRDHYTRFYALGSLLLALFLLSPGSFLGLGAAFDQLNFRVWSTLFPPEQNVAEELALVSLPEGVSTAKQVNLQSTLELSAALSTLNDHKAGAIGIGTDLDPVIWRQQDIRDLFPGKAVKTSAKYSAPYLQLQQQLQQLPIAWHTNPSRLSPRELLIDREFRWPLLFNFHDRLLQYRFEQQAADPYSHYLFDYQQGRILAGFELSLISHAHRSSSLRWQIPDLLRIGPAAKPVSMYGAIRPWPQQAAVAALEANTLQLDTLDKDSIAGKIVLLVAAPDPGLQQLLANFNAVLTDQYSYAPWWQIFVLLPLTLLLWAYSLFAFRRFTTGALSLTAPGLVLMLAMFSITVQVQRGVWIETGDTIIYSLCISIVLLAQSLYRNWQIRARMEADDARLELAQLHLENNNPKFAADQLLLTSMSDDTADLLMETGKVFERKRDYQSARDVYSTVHSYFPSHSQASDALDDISNITGQHPSLSSTLILPDMAVELPQLGRYELIRLLGKGAMGAVYLANDPTIRRQVAIKTLMLNELGDNREELRDRFLREAETAGRLQHPNIVTVYDVGEEGDLAYITMDYVPGGTLADWTHADQLLELDSVYQMMTMVAEALAYAHQQGVIHRDIKPGNLLFNPEDMSVKVADFGIARLAEHSRTKTGAILGSPYYMSPEQVSGKKVGASTDLYSLGVTFYQLLCGNLPFEAESLAQLAWQITNKPHRNIGKFRKGLPRSANRIINTALKKEPGERFANAQEMAAAFDKGAKSLLASQKDLI
jgi:tRNA A-37 threonylcarbamoyl transferase component Bud32